MPALADNDTLLVVAHGNSLRAIIKNLKHIPDDEIAELNLPTATPWVFEFNDDLTYRSDYMPGDAEEIARRMKAVANQASAPDASRDASPSARS